MLEIEDNTYGTRCILPFVDLMEMLDVFEYIILGTAFLSGLYSVFDYDNRTFSCKPALLLNLNCLSVGLPMMLIPY